MSHSGEASASTAVRRAWLQPLLLFLAVFAVYLSCAARDDMHIDAHAATVEAWHIAATGSPWLEGDLTEQMQSNKFIGPAANGHMVGLRMAGPVLAGIPFYWVLNNSAEPADFAFIAGGVAASCLTALAVMLLFLSMRERLGPPIAGVAALCFAFATPTWTISADQLWTHTVTQLGIAGAAFAASRSRWWLAGVFFGIGMLGRPHVALIAALLGLGMGWDRRSLRPVIAIAVPTVLALVVLGMWNQWMFGGWSIEGAYAGRTAAVTTGFEGSAESGDLEFPQLTNVLGFLFSFDRGLFVWTPALLLLLPALVRSWKSLPDWSRWLLLGGVLYSFVQLRLNYFPGGDGFWGYRHGLELVTTVLPAFAFSARRLGAVAKALLPPVIALQCAGLAIGATVAGYYVNIANVWHDNSLWWALRQQPAVIGCWLVLAAVGGVLVSIRLHKQSRLTPSRSSAVTSSSGT